MARVQRGIDDWAERRRRELANLAGSGEKPTIAPAPGSVQRKVGMSPAGKRRLGSVGVSSTSRHRNMPQTAAKKRKGR